MPTITTAAQLLASLGEVVFEADPLSALRARGVTLSPELARLVDTPQLRTRLQSPERRRRAAELRGRRRPTLRLGPLPRAIARLPGGHHDLTLGLKLEKADEVLADVYTRRAIPRAVSLGSGSAASSLDTLLAVLRNELVGVPADPDLRIGTLHITGAPRVSALATRPRPGTPVDPTGRLLVHLPVTLDFDRRPASGGGQIAVSTVKAIATFGIALGARVDGNQLAITAGPLPFQISALDPERLRLEIAADSPLPPKDGGSGDRIGLALELGGFQGTLRDLAIATTMAPTFTLPVGAGFDVVVRHVDVRAVPTSDGPGRLMVGLEIGARPSPVPLSGQPELLERDPFDGSGSHLYVEAHVELFKVLVAQALASGELQRVARGQKSNVTLFGADAELGDGTIGLFLDGALVDECGAFGVNFVDVDFEGWTRFALRGVDGGTLQYETVEELGVGDAHAADIAACLALSVLDLSIFKLGLAGIEWLAGKVSGWIFGTKDPTLPTEGAVFARDVPIPLTELLPRATAVAASIDATAVRVQATVDLVPDTINTYVYLQCLTSGPAPIGGGLPAKGVRVRMMDQDVPAPPGDDAPVPETGTTVTPAGHFREKTVDVSFAPNAADQQLATGTTDSQGRLQLVVRFTGASRAGVLTTTTTIEDIQTLEIISQHTTHKAITEPRPDPYFLFQVTNQPVTDSRSQAGGFVLNLHTKHLGTADQPLVFHVPRPEPIVLG